MVAGVSGLVLPGAGGQPRLELFDVRPGDRGDAGQAGVGAGEEGGEAAQRAVGVDHRAGSQDPGELVQVGAHRRGDLRDRLLQLVPGR